MHFSDWKQSINLLLSWLRRPRRRPSRRPPRRRRRRRRRPRRRRRRSECPSPPTGVLRHHLFERSLGGCTRSCERSPGSLAISWATARMVPGGDEGSAGIAWPSSGAMAGCHARARAVGGSDCQTFREGSPFVASPQSVPAELPRNALPESFPRRSWPSSIYSPARLCCLQTG